MQPLAPIEARGISTSESGNPASGLENTYPMVPGIAQIPGAGMTVAVGTGFVDRIYVIVPLEDRLEIAQGGVFSYYEFEQSKQQELDNQTWLDLLLKTRVAQPAWLGRIVFQRGKPVDVLAFRTGDIYRITEAGNNLVVRSNPSVSAQELIKLKSGDYIQISEGPIKNDGYTWWNIGALEQSSQPSMAGWVVEQPGGYERATGQ
jgi:hypothetical protein